MSAELRFVGIDVSKASLDVAVHLTATRSRLTSLCGSPAPPTPFRGRTSRAQISG
jgi:hypothetical protein